MQRVVGKEMIVVAGVVVDGMIVTVMPQEAREVEVMTREAREVEVMTREVTEAREVEVMTREVTEAREATVIATIEATVKFIPPLIASRRERHVDL
jgi:radical SAM superfamily enzyme with C-terminal helix-hairpin-helix motif